MVESPRTISIPTSSSSFERVMPLTPRETLPIGRASVSLNRMAIPFFVPRKISLSPFVISTAIRASSESSDIAAIPFARGLL